MPSPPVVTARSETGEQRVTTKKKQLTFSRNQWQVSALNKDREAGALMVFKSNVWAGAIIVIGLSFVYLQSESVNHPQINLYGTLNKPMARHQVLNSVLSDAMYDWLVGFHRSSKHRTYGSLCNWGHLLPKNA